MYIYGDQSVTLPEHFSFSKFMFDKLRGIKGYEICLNPCFFLNMAGHTTLPYEKRKVYFNTPFAPNTYSFPYHTKRESSTEDGQTREKLTYQEVTQYAVNLSVALTKLGVRIGDVVAIGSNPFLHYIPTAFAVMFTGAAYTAFDEDIGSAVLKHRCELVKPKYLICSKAFWNIYKDLIKGFEFIETCISVDDITDFKFSLASLASISEDVDSFEPVQVQGKLDTALIVYSSGTTGMSKGIELSHYNCLSTSLLHGFNKMTSLTTAFIVHSWSVYYFASTTFKFISLGRKIVFAYGLPLPAVSQILRDCKVDIICHNPVFISALASTALPTDDYFNHLKMIYCGACPLKAEMINKFKKSYPNVKDIIQCYGMSECGEIMSQLWGTYKPESLGKVSPGAIVKVVDTITREALGPNKIGEICIKGPTVMKGYININRSDYMDENGFYMTKDLAYYDDDEYFFFVDRIPDIIRYAGFKVSPGELENVLLQHPAVLDVGVVGRPAPDVHEVPVAFVVKKPGTEVTEEELIAFVASQVSPHMQLRGGIMFISKVPRNAGGKILRRVLKELL